MDSAAAQASDVVESLRRYLRRSGSQLRTPRPPCVGTITSISGLCVSAAGCRFQLGERCVLENTAGSQVQAEVIALDGNSARLIPVDHLSKLAVGDRVIATGRQAQVVLGDGLLGRVIDGACRPVDGKGLLHCTERRGQYRARVNPLERAAVAEPLYTGVRAIDGMLTLGRGQRVGLFAQSGVGKSRLFGMMAAGTNADINVICLLGERGREVAEFVQNVLGESELERSVVVAVPADSAAVHRVAGAYIATVIAEYFCDRGNDVLLLCDSLTRFAHARREIALAAGEMPLQGGYPASVLASLPPLLERGGRFTHGSITAIYTLLVESDEMADPLLHAAKSILDGHIVLARKLAEQGHYPAIDILASTSRLREAVTDPAGQALQIRFQQLYARLQQNRDLLSAGMYQAGADPVLDQALARQQGMTRFLQQPSGNAASPEHTWSKLQQAVGG